MNIDNISTVAEPRPSCVEKSKENKSQSKFNYKINSISNDSINMKYMGEVNALDYLYNAKKTIL